MIKKNDSRGFTLIELALVLVLGGMMMSAVLKGHAMIESFKLQRLANELQSITVAFNTYTYMYNALPGDDGNNHGWGNINAGNSNGLIEGDNTSDGSEAHEAWQALRQAGILTGNPGATEYEQLIKSPYGGQYNLGYRNFGAGTGWRNCVYVNEIAGNIAESIDVRYDDGLFNAGSITASSSYSSEQVELYYAM